MNIVLLDADSLGVHIDLSSIASLGSFTQYSDTAPAEVIARISQADIIIVNKIEISRNIIEQCKQLKLICVSATGTNNIDHQAAKEHNVEVKNVKGYSSESVAQITWGMILQLINQINYFDNYVKSGEYCQSAMFTNFGRSYQELHTMQLGIIGLGNIGEKVAKIAEAFNMKIAFHSPSGKRKHGLYAKMALKEILATSDIVSIHTPLTDFTLNLIGKEELRQMKSDSILINTARGGIINEAALAEAIDANLIGGAGIDVFTTEPMKEDNPLLRVHNKEKLILTPHIAWASEQARKMLIVGIAENISNFLAQQ